MKHILFFFISYILIFGFVNCLNIVLESNTKTLNIDEVFYIDVIVYNTGTDNIGGDISILGLDKFEQLNGYQNSINHQNINGQQTMIQKISIPIKSKENGNHTIGPAELRVGTGIFKSNLLELTIEGEKMFVGNTSNNIIQKLKNSPGEINFGIDQNNTNLYDNITKEKNIHIYTKIILYIFIILFIIALIIIIIYLITKYHKSPTKVHVVATNKPIVPILDNENFFENINKYIIDVIFYKTGKNYNTQTLIEIINDKDFQNIEYTISEKIKKILIIIQKNKYGRNYGQEVEDNKKEILKLTKNLC